MNLADLMKKGSLGRIATATVATVATDSTLIPKRVATVATVSVANDQNPAANATATDPPLDPDRWCWPNTVAMNTAEIDTFTQRLAAFTSQGMALTDAEALADRLVVRDRLRVTSSRS